MHASGRETAEIDERPHVQSPLLPAVIAPVARSLIPLFENLDETAFLCSRSAAIPLPSRPARALATFQKKHKIQWLTTLLRKLFDQWLAMATRTLKKTKKAQKTVANVALRVVSCMPLTPSPDAKR